MNVHSPGPWMRSKKLPGEIKDSDNHLVAIVLKHQDRLLVASAPVLLEMVASFLLEHKPEKVDKNFKDAMSLVAKLEKWR